MVRIARSVRNVGGVRNPYALAELVSGKKIDWAAMSSLEVRQTLEKTLGTPYEKLFSPEHDSPLYSDLIKVRRSEK